jgi:alpha-glucuronidase
LFFDRRALVRRAGALGFGLALLAAARPAGAETGYDVWLRYAPVTNAERRAAYLSAVKSIVVPTRTPTGAVIRAELQRGLSRMLGSPSRPARAEERSVTRDPPGGPRAKSAAAGGDEDTDPVGDRQPDRHRSRRGAFTARSISCAWCRRSSPSRPST